MLRVARLLSSRAWTLPRRVLECGMSRVGTSFLRGETMHTGLTREESLNLSCPHRHRTLEGVHTHATLGAPCHQGPPTGYISPTVLSPDPEDREYSVKGMLLPYPQCPASNTSTFHPAQPSSPPPSCKPTLGHCRCVNGLAYLCLPLSLQPATLRWCSEWRQNAKDPCWAVPSSTHARF